VPPVNFGQVLELLGVGLLAGTVGGMLGVGGGVVMIPAMVIFLGDRYGPNSLHLYKLAAIATSVFVSIPAAARHLRARAVLTAMLPAILPAATVGTVVGVWVAGHFFQAEQTRILRRIFGVFLEFVVAVQLYQDWLAGQGERSLRRSCPLPSRRLLIGGSVGLPTGLIAGLLGVGGGIWNVPVQYLLFGVRLRYAIATSSFVVVFVSAVTTIVQSWSVAHLPGLSLHASVPLVGWLVPGALVGGWCGAELTHRLPVRWLRYAFGALLALSGLRLILP